MIRRGLFGGAVGGLAVLGLATMAMAQAQPPGADAKLNSPVYSVKLVKAMDECTSPITHIQSVGACLPANSDTDAVSFNSGKLIVKQKPAGHGSQVIYILKSSGASGDNKKDLANKTIQAQLVLRITRGGNFVQQGTQVTWEDKTLLCPSVTVPDNGNAVMKTSLEACGLTSFLAAPNANKEIVSASIVDFTTHKAIAVPGVVHK